MLGMGYVNDDNDDEPDELTSLLPTQGEVTEVEREISRPLARKKCKV